MRLNYDNSLIEEKEIRNFDERVIKIHEALHNNPDDINDFRGWVELKFDDDEIQRKNFRFLLWTQRR